MSFDDGADCHTGGGASKFVSALFELLQSQPTVCRWLREEDGLGNGFMIMRPMTMLGLLSQCFAAYVGAVVAAPCLLNSSEPAG
jgi:hypothetical protein